MGSQYRRAQYRSHGQKWSGDAGGYDAKLTFTPVDPTCPISKEKTLRAKILRRNGHGDLDLIETSPTEDHLLGMALQSPGRSGASPVFSRTAGRDVPS